jgi:hypothetical protein
MRGKSIPRNSPIRYSESAKGISRNMELIVGTPLHQPDPASLSVGALSGHGIDDCFLPDAANRRALSAMKLWEYATEATKVVRLSRRRYSQNQ